MYPVIKIMNLRYSRYVDGKREFTVEGDIPLSKEDVEILRTNPNKLIDVPEK